MRLSLRSKKILITAGPTREYFDPVRFLTNASSGEMGFVLAQTLAHRGADVVVVHGPMEKRFSGRFKTIPIVSALEMYQSVKREIKHSDVFIATAAVSDWRFEKIHAQKEKKGSSSALSIKLKANPDILFEMGRLKKHPTLIGFALETNSIENAMRNKLKHKNLDLIIGNSPASFANKSIVPTWLDREQKITKMPEMTKRALAQKIADWIERHG